MHTRGAAALSAVPMGILIVGVMGGVILGKSFKDVEHRGWKLTQCSP